VFEDGHEGTRLRVGGKEVLITDVASATVASASVIETLSGTGATIDWFEQAYSRVRASASIFFTGWFEAKNAPQCSQTKTQRAQLS
jgi:hypothetical protein